MLNLKRLDYDLYPIPLWVRHSEEIQEGDIRPDARGFLTIGVRVTTLWDDRGITTTQHDDLKYGPARKIALFDRFPD